MDCKSVIVVSNHISFSDPPILGFMFASVRKDSDIYFLAKKELFQSSKTFEKILHILYAIPLDRKGFDASAMKNAFEVLNEGHCLCIFPEGTRNKTEKILKGKAGAGYIALKGNYPILPIYIENSNKNFFLLFIRILTLKVKIGRPFYLPSVKANSKNSKIAVSIMLKEIEKLRLNV